MTNKEQNSETARFDGDGNEIIGSLDVVKIKHADGSARPYHLEIHADDGVTGELVKFGSEVFGNIDLLSVGIRGALIEALAREKGV